MGNKIEIKKMYVGDLGTMYPEIYRSVFESSDDFQIPSIVYLGFENGEYKGFISGYLHNIQTFYMQYAGIIKSKRGFGTVSMFREAVREMQKEYAFILAAIRNDNIVAIKIAMNEGFVINGIRQDTGKNIYVELIRGGNSYGATC